MTGATLKTEKLEWSEDLGMTKERFNQAAGAIESGGDERAGKVYHFKDSSLARIYARLKANAMHAQLRDTETQERALERYYTAFVEGAMMGSVGSVDLGGGAASNPGARDHAAKTNWQIDRRDEFAKANKVLTQNQRDVTRIIVLCGGSTEEAGRFLGKRSRQRAEQSAVQLLRAAGDVLAKIWGMG